MKGKNIASLLLLFIAVNATAQTGVISGKIVDAKTGETLMGATVAVDDNQNLAASTDLDGNFTIQKVPVGKHKVKVRYIGYKEKEQDEVVVKANEVTNVNVALLEDAVNLNEVAIVATVTKRDNESAIFVMQKNSTVIQSGISSEEMKRSPDKNSGEVIRRVSGSTIQDGKFAIIRGLADRYNMAMLNNTVLSSTEPDRKAFAFDVFPSNILDNIIIMKTGQPNLPSEWSGGLIQLNTRDIPEKNFFNASYGISFTENTTFRKFKTYEGSKTDFLGFDNSVRKLPSDFPTTIELNDLKLLTDPQQKRDTMVALGKKINNSSWKVRDQIAYPGQSLQLSGGFAVRKNDIQLGGVLGLTYSNSLRIVHGTRTRYDAADNALYYDFDDVQHNNSVTAALLGNIGVVIKNNHKITWKNIYTINSDKTTYLREGVSYFSAAEMQRTSLEFVSSRVFSSNLSGEHVLGKQEIKWRWNGGVTLVNRDQPKSMRYSYERPYTNSNGTGPNQSTAPYIYMIQSGGSDPKQSAMFYSQLAERVYNAGTDLSIPFKIKNQKQIVSVGYSYQNRSRNFGARNLFFDYTNNSSSSDSVMQNLNVDAIINQTNFNNGKLILNQMAFPQDQYKANAQLHAAYVMMENNITDRFKAVWGFRFESFHQELTSPTKIGFKIDQDDEGNVTIRTKMEDSTYVKSYFSGAYKSDSVGTVKSVFPLLPSVNLIYKLNENMNLRASYSQSMSRPEFRECSPFLYYDFLRDVNLSGNVNLLQTFVHNADLRYEFFMGRGQAVNVSVFYKHFTNTIELTSIAAGGVQQFIYNNAGEAHLVGAELEVRKNFDFISKKLEDLTFVANLAYIYSRVNLAKIKNNAGEEKQRGMQGQSPYIVNLGLSYEHPTTKTGVTLLYNQVGQRLYAVGEVGNPSWYEHWRPLLDLQLSQRFWKNRGMVRFTVSDLIAKKTIFYQNHKPDTERFYQQNKDNVVQSVNNYRTYSIQLSFNF
ncbi:MAG: TonB-dependent receptor [Chitinophagales bacterium]|nr:TonB-dependent receptor [Chitinophagales bacterium]